MTPIHFPEATGILNSSMEAKDLGPIPVRLDGQSCLTCWHLSWGERLHLLRRGRLWVALLTEDALPQPIALSVLPWPKQKPTHEILRHPSDH